MTDKVSVDYPIRFPLRDLVGLYDQLLTDLQSHKPSISLPIFYTELKMLWADMAVYTEIYFYSDISEQTPWQTQDFSSSTRRQTACVCQDWLVATPVVKTFYTLYNMGKVRPFVFDPHKTLGWTWWYCILDIFSYMLALSGGCVEFCFEASTGPSNLRRLQGLP